MTNYICINGKKAELTKEQLKALGIELPKANPFERVNKDKIYYSIHGDGIVHAEREDLYDIDKERFDVGNYCTDKEIMKQRALHETLNRLLWRYSMEHDRDKIEWNDRERKYYIYFNHSSMLFEVAWNDGYENVCAVYFYEARTAHDAIKEIIEPFMKEHPDFKW